MASSNDLCFILTGTPGTGKTSVLECLQRGGAECHDEPVRAVLKHQLATNGPALPSKDPLLFIQEMLERCRRNFISAALAREPVFFDRGIPDLVAYAIRFGVSPTELEDAAAKLRYNRTVFLFPPWKDIFVNDGERRLTYEASLSFHELLVSSYERLGYVLMEVPRSSVESRVEFVRDRVR